MTQISPTYNFTTENEGLYTIFKYKKTPVSYKIVGPLCFYTAIPAVAFTALIRPSGMQSAIIIWLVIMVALAFIITIIINALRKTGEFKVSISEVVVGERKYDKDHISAFFIKDPSGNNNDATIITVRHHNPLSMASNVSNLSSSVGQMGQESRMAIRRHFQDAGYKICIRFGTKDIAIAKGLGEQEADVMLRKVMEAIKI